MTNTARRIDTNLSKMLKSSKESYAYEAWTVSKEGDITGHTGTISTALVSNLASPKNPTFFLSTDERVLELQAIDKARLINRAGKTTYLTKRQQKIVFALSMILSKHKDDEEVQQYIQRLKEGKNVKSRITIPISITALTKLVTTDGKARARQKQDVLNDLRALAEIQQVQIFGEFGTQEGQLRFLAPLIHIDEQIEDLTKGKKLDADYVGITLGRLFFYELTTRYATIKPTLFQLWGKQRNGTDTELFGILLADLLSKYGMYRLSALNASKKLKGKANDKALQKAQKEALTYREYTETIQERVITGYGNSREQRKRFRTDLEGAIGALIDYGLITEDTKLIQTQRGEAVDFVFNLDYARQEVKETYLPSRNLTILPNLESIEAKETLFSETDALPEA